MTFFLNLPMVLTMAINYGNSVIVCTCSDRGKQNKNQRDEKMIPVRKVTEKNNIKKQ